MKKCFDCNSKNIIDLGNNYIFNNPFFGEISSSNYHIYQCKDCGMILINKRCRQYLQNKTNKIIENYLKKIISNDYKKDFYDEKEVILKNGFIHESMMKIKYNKKNIYWKKSVNQFIENQKDGRIKII